MTSGASNEKSRFVLPNVWNDDDAMYSLMQPIKRPKHIDPVTYNSKVEFWNELILQYAETERVLVVTQNTLQLAFSRYFQEEGITLGPQCLNEVFEHLKIKQLLQLCDNRAITLGSLLWEGMSYLLKKPVSFAWDWLLGSSSTQTTQSEADTPFVFNQLADRFAEQFMNWFNDTRTTQRLTFRLPVYEERTFEEALSSFFTHELSRAYIRHLFVDVYRCVQPQTISSGNSSMKVVRVSTKLTTKLTPPEDPSTEAAILSGLANLNRIIAQLESEDTKLSDEIETRRSRIKALLREKRVKEATQLLRRTKGMEAVLAQKHQQLHKLEMMKMQIDSASDNHRVLDTLAASSRALQQTTGGTKGLAKAEETVAQLHESVQDAEEISDLISSFGHATLTNDDDDDAELEAALAELTGPEPVAPAPPAVKKVTPKPVSEVDDDTLERELEALDIHALLPAAPTHEVGGLEQEDGQLPS